MEKEKNIVYLLGAGASVNAIPILESFSIKMHEVLLNNIFKRIEHWGLVITNAPSAGLTGIELELDELKRQCANDVDWFLKESKKHKSIDTLAKRLFLTQNFKDLKRLKALMSLYLMWVQIPQKYDQRYDSFFATMLYREDSKLKLPSNIKIISWNYDLQFEISLINYLQKNSLLDIHNEWAIWPNCYYSEFNESPLLVKLNGTAGLYLSKKTNKIETLFTDLLLVKENVANHIILLKQYTELRDNYDLESLIHFAWEESDVTKRSFQAAQKYISEADAIVIIGYSFPIFNKQKDTQLFDGLKKLKIEKPRNVKIYIQDPKADSIANRLKSNFAVIREMEPGPFQINLKSQIEIYEEKYTDQFLTPDDL